MGPIDKLKILLNMSSPRKNDGGLILPLTRVKTIMKSSPDVESISSDALYYVTKAAEFFIEHLAQEIFENNKKQTEITYSGLAEVVQDNESMEFLKEMVPKKITFQEYNDLMKKEQENVDY